VSSSLLKCDEDIRASLESFAALQLTNTAWDQAQLSLSSGGLGLRSLSTHCVAAYINSHLCALPNLLTASLRGAFALYSAQLGKPVDDLAIASMVDNPPSQRTLSSKLERLVYSRLYSDALVGDKLRLISVAARRSAAWLQAMPSRGPLDLTLLPDEMQVLLQHRLGLPLSRAGETCPIRCGELLDVLGHHQLTCKHGGFVVSRHNRVRDALFSLAAVAGMGPQKEQGAFMRDRTRPADILVNSWSLGKPAAFDLTFVSPQTQDNLRDAGNKDVVERAALDKHLNNDPKCTELGWLCIPLAADTYGQWCEEAHTSFCVIASNLAVSTKVSLSIALTSIYNTLGLVLARQNARSILARRFKPNSMGAREVRHLGSGHS